MPIETWTITDLLKVGGSLTTSGLTFYFIHALASKKLAWWYQVEERDALILKAEAREKEAKDVCAKWERLYFESKDITFTSLNVVEKQVGSK